MPSFPSLPPIFIPISVSKESKDGIPIGVIILPIGNNLILTFQHFPQRLGLPLKASNIHQPVTRHQEGSLDVLAYQLMPLDLVKHLIFLEITKGTAQSRLSIFVEQQRDEGVDGRVLHILGELQRILQYLLVNLQRVLRILSIRYVSRHKLEQHNAKRPQISRE